ncbi:hypothetical protein CANARDRAFT_6006 [[Candida] arabinofermentans NRRL YB-2248]|uniref:hydroxyacylglutathione hydrolase n=1 Tax=[Candida] arabinofermentans NRRL YB-2248 TaxID=983967 RepID=A0A1E4T6V3_9ASCO|nr:hypothetical protein CANARDRAFT_6006 [[Candida] arabinofermentans NRRL YB-2248]
MRWKSGDNFCYILSDTSTSDSWIIDPAYPDDIKPYLTAAKKNNIKAIVNTHHHYDHAGGNAELLESLLKNPDLPVIAGKDSQKVTYTPKDGEKIKLGQDLEISCIHTPCHTRDSICYYVEDLKTNEKCVFTGDTLFISGCGRFFEGDAKEMKEALEKLMKLPDDTKVYPGHEYTLSNVRFSKSVLGGSNKSILELEKFCLKNDVSTGFFTVADEKTFNPFIRLDDPNVIAATGETDPVKVMDKLRTMKNKF